MGFIFALLLLPQVINFLLALIPAMILLNYFYKRDPRPEPRQIVMKTFFLGIAATVPAVIIELLIEKLAPGGMSPIITIAFKAFIVVALVEESCKLYMVKRYIYPHPEFDEVTDGIIYTMAAALGFAFLENILYSMNSGNSWTILLTRGITAVPLHGLTSAVMGFYIGKTKLNGKNLIPFGLFLAVLYHGLYDFFLFYGGLLSWLSIPLLIILFFHAKHILHNAIDEDKKFFRS
ncbi:MAG: hypothetical protein B6241_11665 [Spirochaetaceae bacterium 4572_59]|nr:MAG: hypothetical protein B6241_11665 [Spirochaetaceae bacterium 4572_59]